MSFKLIRILIFFVNQVRFALFEAEISKIANLLSELFIL